MYKLTERGHRHREAEGYKWKGRSRRRRMHCCFTHQVAVKGITSTGHVSWRFASTSRPSVLGPESARPLDKSETRAAAACYRRQGGDLSAKQAGDTRSEQVNLRYRRIYWHWSHITTSNLESTPQRKHSGNNTTRAGNWVSNVMNDDLRSPHSNIHASEQPQSEEAIHA